MAALVSSVNWHTCVCVGPEGMEEATLRLARLQQHNQHCLSIWPLTHSTLALLVGMKEEGEAQQTLHQTERKVERVRQ